MNPVLETIMNHRSIRKFKDVLVPAEDVKQIVEAAQMASSSSFRQSYSILGITDPEIKQEIVKITKQDFIGTCGHLFLFAVDLHRVSVNATEEEIQQMQESLSSTLMYQVAVVDTALAAQNAALAAESMGYGIVMLGSILHAVGYLNEALGLPERVMPLFGLAVGVPDEQPEQKQRLPLQAVYHENGYLQDQPVYQELIQGYDEHLSNYYQTRSTNQKEESWSAKSVKMMSRPAPVEFSAYVHMKGLNKK